MRTQKDNAQYLHNLAQTMIQQLHVPISTGSLATKAQEIYLQFADDIRSKLSVMNPETRGRIADLGLADDGQQEQEEVSMALVHLYESFLDKRESGRAMVTEIACTTIVAKMAEIIWKESLSFQPQSAAEEMEDIRAREPLDMQ